MRRREFLAATAAAALPLHHLGRVGELPADGMAPPVRPFDLSAVRLLPGPFLDAMAVNRRFVMALDPDRLLHMFRLTAGSAPLPAEPLGGWEAPDNELRGHFTGHYLSACALMSASQGDGELKARGDHMVAELAKCQKRIGNGYLSAFPEELFDRLRAGQPRVGAVLHAAQDHGRPARHAHAGGQRAGARRARGHGELGGRAGPSPLGDDDMAAHARARVRRHERGALQPLRRDEARPVARTSRTASTTSASSRPLADGTRRAEGSARQHQHPQGDRRGAALRADR